MSNRFQFHGFRRPPQTVATRHTILVLLALHKRWMATRLRGVDPVVHFNSDNLLSELAAEVGPKVKKVLPEEDIFAHLLFLSEFRLNATDVLVRNHAGPETKGQPIFQLGRAGEELCTSIHYWDLEKCIEDDTRLWQPLVLWSRLINQGECGPDNWTLGVLTSLTSLNRGQLLKALKVIQQGFIAVGGSATKEFPPVSSLRVGGTRKTPYYGLPSNLKMQKPCVGGPLFVPDCRECLNCPDCRQFMDDLVDDLVEPTSIEAPVISDAESGALLKEVIDEVFEGREALDDVFQVPNPPKPKPKPESQTPLTSLSQAHVRLTPDEVDALKTEAQVSGQTVEGVVSFLLKQGIELMVTHRKKQALRLEHCLRHIQEAKTRLAGLCQQAEDSADGVAQLLKGQTQRVAMGDPWESPVEKVQLAMVQLQDIQAQIQRERDQLDELNQVFLGLKAGAGLGQPSVAA